MSESTGRRIRILLEWHRSEMATLEAQTFLEEVLSDLGPRCRDAVVATYIETNPPADEI